MKVFLVIVCLIFAVFTGIRLPATGLSDINNHPPAASTENLGIFGASRKSDVLGQDGVTPIALTDQITMWTFGDTILGNWKKEVSVADTFDDAVAIKSMLSNSLAFTVSPTDNNVPDLEFTFYKENSAVTPFIKNLPEEDPAIWRFWTIDGIRIGDVVYVYYMIITIDHTLQTYPFAVKGTGIARWAIPEKWQIGDPVRFERLGMLFDKDQPTFGDSVILKDGYLYLIGHGKAAAGEIGVSVQITRVRPEDIEEKTAYRYLRTDGRFTCLYRDAGRFLHDVAGECSLSFNEVLNSFVIIYCNLWSGDIIRVIFDDFSKLNEAEKKVVYTPPPLVEAKRDIPVSYYSAKEIFHTRDHLYAIYIQPVIYQPILLKIPY